MVTGEAYGWNEGKLWLWTGSATASAEIQLAQNIRVNTFVGWERHQAVNGAVAEHPTGVIANLVVQRLYTYDSYLPRFQDTAAPVVHAHVYHSGRLGSAGLILYSGRIDELALEGQEGNILMYTLSYHGNQFSAYGGS